MIEQNTRPGPTPSATNLTTIAQTEPSHIHIVRPSQRMRSAEPISLPSALACLARRRDPESGWPVPLPLDAPRAECISA